MIYDLISPYSSIRSRKKCSKKFFLMAENWKLDSQIFLLHSNFFLLRSQHGQIPLPCCSAKICYSSYVELQKQVNRFSIIVWEFLRERFEIWLKKFIWTTLISIAIIHTQLCGRVSWGSTLQNCYILLVRGFGSRSSMEIWV